MDKVTQAMVAHKASAMKSDMKSFGGGLVGDEKDEEKREKAENKWRHNSLKEMEDRRERQRNERMETHRKREEEREIMRCDIRNKCKLKGSPSYDGSQQPQQNNNSHELSKHSEEICTQEDEKNCSIQ